MAYVIVPGWRGSELAHWQSHWEQTLDGCVRVELPDWIAPTRADWIGHIDRAVRGFDHASPPIVIAHSLGCHGVARWAARWRVPIAGAVFVAPCDVDREDAPQALRELWPIPRTPLPFPSMIVASTTDPYVSLASAEGLARAWGSRFVLAGDAGHINVASGHGPWPEGLALLARFAAEIAPAAGRRAVGA